MQGKYQAVYMNFIAQLLDVTGGFMWSFNPARVYRVQVEAAREVEIEIALLKLLRCGYRRYHFTHLGLAEDAALHLQL